ncbi:MAG: GGDEF domain-containing protein [Rhizobiaceae bacterium]|nr:GGDEF domain-containing protein [Rhizobiaceae bacterium]
MTGAGFILAINLFMAGLFAAAFMTIAIYDPRRESARWFALGYAVGMSNFLFEFAIASFGVSAILALAAFGSFLTALAIFNVGVAQKYSIPVPWLTMSMIILAALVACYFTLHMSRESFVRMLIYQSPYFVMQAIAAGLVAQSRARETLDNLLLALLAASALQFLSKPFLFQMFGGTGKSADLYITTGYAMLSQSMGTIFAMAIALMLLVILVRDVLADAHERSETDALSGLLNRGGFGLHSATAIEQADRQGIPVSLIIADLDHFKSVNDKFGHAAGDAVIVAFSNFLRSAMAPHHVAGRIGGEEFAVLLPGTNLVAARLFAEGARGAFANLDIEGMPPGRRCTASFGVAELGQRETIGELMARADEALYLAKNSGRDCVKIAPRSGRRRDECQGTAISIV